MNKLKRFLLTTTILLSVGKLCIAEDVITGNILPNAGNPVSSLNSGSAPIISDDTSLNNLTQNEVLTLLVHQYMPLRVFYNTNTTLQS